MKYKTRDFGEVEIDDAKIVHFAQPIFGFDEYRKYFFLYDEDIGEQFTFLQSAEEPGLCFILFDPSARMPDYAPRLPENIEQILGEGEYECWSVAVIREDFKRSTINLKSPILVNLLTRQAAQIILEQDYPVRCPLLQEADAC